MIFPLGDLTKQEVRALAQKYELNVADKAESMDICFVPDSGYKEFIRTRVGDSVFVEGDFVNHNGQAVGRHKGILNYTIGQRDKLGIALGEPMYVNRIDKENNTVHIGPKEMLYADGLIANQFNPLTFQVSDKPITVHCRIRYNSPEVEAYLTYLGDDNIKVEFKEPQMSVTPGQSVVFYNGDIVLAGAVIKEPIKYKKMSIKVI